MSRNLRQIFDMAHVTVCLAHMKSNKQRYPYNSENLGCCQGVIHYINVSFSICKKSCVMRFYCNVIEVSAHDFGFA